MEEKREFDKSLKLIAKSSFIIFVMMMFSKIFSYVYRIVVARYFGAEIYGVITLTMVIVGFVVSLAIMGTSGGLVRFIPKYIGEGNTKKIKYLLKATSIIIGVTSIISAVLIYFLSDYIALEIFNNANLSIFLKIFSFLIPLWIFSNFFRATLGGLEKMGWSAFLEDIVPNLTKLVVLIILISLGFQSESIALSYIAAYVFLFLFSFFIYKKFTKSFYKQEIDDVDSKKVLNEFFAFSFPLVFAGIITQIFLWIDSISIGYFMSVENVGIYNAAVPVAYLFTFAPAVFTKLFLPMITREYAKKEYQTTKDVSQQVGKWIFMVNFPILVLIVSFPEQIISLLFGPDFIGAASSLRILAIGSFFLAQSNVSEKLILIAGKSKLILKTILFTSVLGVVLNVLLVPKIGIEGAALSTAIIYFILGALFFYLAKKNMMGIIPIRKKAIRVTGISIALFLVLILLKTYIIINIFTVILVMIISMTAYLFLIFKTGCLDKNDLMVLRSILAKLKRKNGD